MKERSFWYWLKYALRNGGRYRTRKSRVYQENFDKFEIYLGDTRIMSQNKSKLLRHDWIEKL